MRLSLTQFQASLLKECLKSYNTQLLTSSEEWGEYDNLFEKLAGLSDTRGDAVFNNDSYKSPAQNVKQRVGKDMDLL